MSRFLCVWLVNWPVQRVVVERPELRSKPVVLYVRDSRQRQLVVACSSKARSLGVRDNMSLADATAIVEGEQPFTIPHDATADREELIVLADWCNQFTPAVSVEWPDGLCLQVDAVTHIYGDESTLVDHVAKRFYSRGYQPRLAIADTPSAAWALAHFASAPSTIVGVAQMQPLFELPVAALRLSEATLQKLDRLGIHRIRQLAELPRKSLPSRIGQEALHRLDYLTGDKVESPSKYTPLPAFEQQWLFDQATNHPETVEHVIHLLLGRLAEKLRRHRKGATRLAILLDCTGNSRVRIDVGLYRPSADAQRFFNLVQMQLETAKLPAAIECITAVAEETETIVQLQQSLLDRDSDGNQRELAHLVERLNSRLAADCVVRAVLVDDLQPDKSFCYQPLTPVNEPRATSSRNREELGHICSDSPDSLTFGSSRPLQMFIPPLDIDVIAVVPNGPPVHFHYEGEHRVARCWGPDRLETAWWRGASVKRDYYRVETESGSRFWLFRRLDDGQWFLHGCFD